MERISLTKNTRIKNVILSGMEGQNYTLALQTNCVETPIYVFYNREAHTVGIYDCRLKMDEFILVDYNFPAKVSVIIAEYISFNDTCHAEVASVLEKIVDGSFFHENTEVKYL